MTCTVTAQSTAPLAAAQADRRLFVSLWASSRLRVHLCRSGTALPPHSASGADQLLGLACRETLLSRRPTNSCQPARGGGAIVSIYGIYEIYGLCAELRYIIIARNLRNLFEAFPPLSAFSISYLILSLCYLSFLYLPTPPCLLFIPYLSYLPIPRSYIFLSIFRIYEIYRF